MKKLLAVSLMTLVLAGCSYHAKQPVDATYYKQTQGIAYPEKKAVQKPAQTKSVAKPTRNRADIKRPALLSRKKHTINLNKAEGKFSPPFLILSESNTPY